MGGRGAKGSARLLTVPAVEVVEVEPVAAPTRMSFHDMAVRLQAMTVREQANQFLEHSSKADLLGILEVIGVGRYGRTYRPGDSKSKLRNHIVELTVGRRADSIAIEKGVNRKRP